MNKKTRYEYFVVGLMFFTWGAVFLDRMAELYLAPYIAKDFHLNAGQIGELASILAITWAFSSFLFGAVSDKIGRKPVLVFLVALFMKETAPEATEAQAAQAVS